MAQTPEGKIKMQLDKMLRKFDPGLWFFSPQSGIYGKSGVPDRIVCYSGHFIGIECKAGRSKKPTALQLATMGAIDLAGGLCFVACDDTSIQEIHELLCTIRARDRILS